MAGATADVITAVARTNPTEAQEPTNQPRTLFVQLEKRVSRSASHATGLNSR